MARLREIYALCVTGGVPRRSLTVAVAVGTLLNLVNQGDALLNAGEVNVLKLALTYIVPYCVATYGAVSMQLRMRDAQRDVGGVDHGINRN